MNIRKDLANCNYGNKRDIKDIKFIVIHYTANRYDTALANCNYFKEYRGASAHYFVDEQIIAQSVPDNIVAWSVGGGLYPNINQTGGGKKYYVCNNSNSISIEMCDSVDGVPSKTLQNVIELTNYLMDKYDIPVGNVIRHFDVTGKNCPKPFVEKVTLWNDFKERLGDYEMRYNKFDELPNWSKPTIRKLLDEGKIVDYNNLDLTLDMIRVLVIMNR